MSETKECKQCKPCLSNILAAQDDHQHAVNEINALLQESDNMDEEQRQLLRSIRTYIGLAHNALNRVYEAQGRGDLKEYSSDKLCGENAWGAKKNGIRERASQRG